MDEGSRDAAIGRGLGRREEFVGTSSELGELILFLVAPDSINFFWAEGVLLMMDHFEDSSIDSVHILFAILLR